MSAVKAAGRPTHRGVLAAAVLTGAGALGVLGAVVWWWLVDLPTYTRAADSGSMDAVELSRSVGIDAWFAVTAGVLGFLLGAGLLLRAVRAPRAAVFVGLGAATLAGLVMVGVGRLLGPGDLDARLAAASPGDRVPVPLVPNSDTLDVLGLPLPLIVLVWPVAALAGAVLVLVLAPPPDEGPPPR